MNGVVLKKFFGFLSKRISTKNNFLNTIKYFLKIINGRPIES